MRRLIFVVALLFLVAGITGNAVAQSQGQTTYDITYQRAYQHLKLHLEDVPAGFVALENKFGKLNNAEQLQRALAELMEAVDGELLDGNATQAWKARIASGYIGLGLSFDELQLVGNDGVLVTDVIAESTAEEAGMLSGDRIVAVDGEPAYGQTLRSVTERIAGPDGSFVDIVVDRQGSKETLRVKRDLDERIGVEVSLDKPRVLLSVRYVIGDSPAESAGLVEGDVIETIEGRAVESLSMEEALALLDKEFIGDLVTVSVLRDGNRQTFDIETGIVPYGSDSVSFQGQSGSYTGDLSFNRAIIAIKNLDWSEDNDWLMSFAEWAADYPGTVLDLRGASGDNVPLAVGLLASLFDADGELLRVRERVDGKEVVTIYVLKNGAIERHRDGGVETLEQVNGQAFTGKLVVVIDGSTSGTAEAMAHALQRTGRARLVGSSTDGRAELVSRTLLNSTTAVAFPSATLLMPDGTEMRSAEPDRGVLLGTSPLETAKKELAGIEWHNDIEFISYAVFGIIVAVVLLLIVVSLRRSIRRQESSPAADDAPVAPAESKAAEPPSTVVETADQQPASRHSSRWFLLVPVVMLLMLFALPKLMQWTIAGPPAGAYSVITVEFFTDGSESCASQQAVIDRLAGEYSGSIEFKTIDIRDNPDVTKQYRGSEFGAVEHVPSIRIVKQWFDADGSEISTSWQGQGKTPRRRLIPQIERTAESNRDFWPDTPIQRNKP